MSKKSKLEKIKKELQKAQQVREEEINIRPKKKQKKVVVGVAGLKGAEKKAESLLTIENERVDFLIGLSADPAIDKFILVDKIKEFGQNPSHTHFVDTLLELTPRQIFEYIGDYLSQSIPRKLGVEDSLNNFIEQKIGEEERKRRELFRELSSLEKKSDILNKLKEFANEKRAPLSRKEFVELMTSIFSEAKHYKVYFKEFLGKRNRDGLRSDKYLLKYVSKRPKLHDKLEDMEKEDKVMEKEDEVMEKEEKVMEKEDEEESLPDKVDEGEEKQRREFFEKLFEKLKDEPDLEDSELLEFINKFIEEDEENKDRFIFIKTLSNTFNRKYLLKFLTEYLSQKEHNSLEIFSEFIASNEKLLNRLQAINEVLGEYKYKPILPPQQGEEVVLEEEKIIVEEEDGKPKIKRQVIYDYKKLLEGKESSHEIPFFMQQCMLEYNIKPWIDNYKWTWIIPRELNEKYVNKSLPTLELNGKFWYRPSKLWELLNCNLHRNKREQKGDIFIMRTDDNLPVSFFVVHELQNSNFLVQDEELFTKEKEWFSRQQERLEDRLNELLSQKISDSSEKLVKYMREYVGGLFKELIGEGEELESSIFTLSQGGTIRDYLKKSASVLLFVSPYYMGNYASIFRERVKNGYYAHSTLPLLKNDDKLPEVYGAHIISDEQKIFTTQYIEKEENQIVIEIGRILYRYQYPTEKIPPLLYIDVPERITLSSLPFQYYSYVQKGTEAEWEKLSKAEREKYNISKICANDVKESKPWELVYYPDGDKTYCFNVYDLMLQISVGDSINPYTGKEFGSEFVDKIGQFAEMEEKKQERKEEKEEEILVPNFLEIILSDIAKLEKGGLFKFGDSKGEPKKCEKCSKEVNGELKSPLSDGNIVEFCSIKCFEEWETPK